MKSGFVVILGRPNVGKSTLLNALVGSKVVIVTPKPQTTREAIQGVVQRPEGQIVLVDSPGIHEPSLELGRRMMKEVRQATVGCHIVLLMVDATEPDRPGDRAAIDMVRHLKPPAFLLLNKVDLLKEKAQLLPQIESYRARHEFAEYMPLSAYKGTNLESLLKSIYGRLPEAPPYYPEDFITNQPERFLAAELIREQIIFQTHQEVPHASAVLIDHWEESEHLLRLAATVFVERHGQKAIVIGARGQKMKQVATAARKSLEARFGRKVFLEVFVKVHPKWRDRPGFLRSLDYRAMLGGEAPPPMAPAATGSEDLSQ